MLRSASVEGTSVLRDRETREMMSRPQTQGGITAELRDRVTHPVDRRSDLTNKVDFFFSRFDRFVATLVATR
jgi:hypothetical protein